MCPKCEATDVRQKFSSFLRNLGVRSARRQRLSAEAEIRGAVAPPGPWPCHD